MVKDVIAWLVFNAVLVAMSAVGYGVLGGLLFVLKEYDLPSLTGVAALISVAAAWGFAYAVYRLIQYLADRRYKTSG